MAIFNVNERHMSVSDSNWNLFGSNDCWDTVQWPTLQPLQASNVDWTTSLQWADLPETGSTHDISMGDKYVELFQSHSHPSSPNLGPTTDQEASNNAIESGSTAKGSEDGASHKSEKFV